MNIVKTNIEGVLIDVLCFYVLNHKAFIFCDSILPTLSGQEHHPL